MVSPPVGSNRCGRCARRQLPAWWRWAKAAAASCRAGSPDRRGYLAVAADDRDVEHGHLGLRRVAPAARSAGGNGRLRSSAAMSEGRLQPSPSLAANGPASASRRCRRRSPECVTPAADSRWFSGSQTPSRYGLVPGCHRARSSRWPTRARRPGPGRRECRPNPACCVPPAGPDAAERRPPLSTSSVATVLAKIPGARNVTVSPSVPRRRGRLQA